MCACFCVCVRVRVRVRVREKEREIVRGLEQDLVYVYEGGREEERDTERENGGLYVKI